MGLDHSAAAVRITSSTHTESYLQLFQLFSLKRLHHQQPEHAVSQTSLDGGLEQVLDRTFESAKPRSVVLAFVADA